MEQLADLSSHSYAFIPQGFETLRVILIGRRSPRKFAKLLALIGTAYSTSTPTPKTCSTSCRQVSYSFGPAFNPQPDYDYTKHCGIMVESFQGKKGMSSSTKDMCIIHIRNIRLEVNYTCRYKRRVKTNETAEQIFTANMVPTTKLAR